MIQEYREAIKDELALLRSLLYILNQPVMAKINKKKPQVVAALVSAKNVDGLRDLIRLEAGCQYADMSMRELRALAKSLKIKYYTKYTRDALIKEINKG